MTVWLFFFNIYRPTPPDPVNFCIFRKKARGERSKDRREQKREEEEIGKKGRKNDRKQSSANDLTREYVQFPPSVKKAWWPKQILKFSTILVIS